MKAFSGDLEENGIQLNRYEATSHSAYVAKLTELHGVEIHGFLHPNFMQIPKKKGKVPPPSLPCTEKLPFT